MMKIAVCLYGKYGTQTKHALGKEFDALDYHKNWKENLIKNNPNFTFVFFIHSWSYEQRKKIQDFYRPKASNIEKPYFHFSLRYLINYALTNIQRQSNRAKTILLFIWSFFAKTSISESPYYRAASGSLSQAKSTENAIKILEEDTSEDIDYVILSRIDLVFLKKIDLSFLENRKKTIYLASLNNHMQDLNFNKFSLPDGYDYSIERKKLNDMFLIFDKKLIKKFRKYYKDRKKLNLPSSPHKSYYDLFEKEILSKDYDIKFIPGGDFSIGRVTKGVFF